MPPISDRMAHDAAVAYYEIENPDVPFDTLPLERIQVRRRCARAALEAVADEMEREAITAAERAADLAERCVDAIAAISEALSKNATGGGVMRARAVIAGLDPEVGCAEEA